MEEKIKQRLIGVLVLIGALFIILPFLFHNSHPAVNAQNADNSGAAVSLPVTPVNNTAEASGANTAQNTAQNADTTAAAVTVQATPDAAAQQAQSAAPADAAALEGSAATAQAANAPQGTLDQTAPAAQQAASAEQSPANQTAANTAAANSSAEASSAPAAAATPASTASAAQAAPAVSSESLTSAQAVTTGKDNPPFQPQTAQNDAAQNTANAAAAPPAAIVAHHHAAVKSAHAAPRRGWIVQLAVFSERKHAHDLMAKLRYHHFAAYSRTIKHNQHTMTAVFVGPEASMQKAETIRLALQRNFRLNGVVKKWQA